MFKVFTEEAWKAFSIKLKKSITDLNNHIKNKSNPHRVSKTDVGLSEVTNASMVSDEGAYNTITNLGYYADAKITKNYTDKVLKKIETHEKKTNNPHSVTKSQVGLGNVRNSSTIDNLSTLYNISSPGYNVDAYIMKQYVNSLRYDAWAGNPATSDIKVKIATISSTGKNVYFMSHSQYFPEFNPVDLNTLNILPSNMEYMYILSAHMRPDWPGVGYTSYHLPHISKGGSVTSILYNYDRRSIGITNNVNWSGYWLRLIMLATDK